MVKVWEADPTLDTVMVSPFFTLKVVGTLGAMLDDFVAHTMDPLESLRPPPIRLRRLPVIHAVPDVYLKGGAGASILSIQQTHEQWE
jgi:hypothetical protein